MTAALTVSGNVNINGALVLSGSVTPGGDILVGGNWTRASAGTFTPNGRAVFFNGAGTKVVTVTGGGTETFAFLLVQNTASLQLAGAPNATNINVTGTNGLTLSSTG